MKTIFKKKLKVDQIGLGSLLLYVIHIYNIILLYFKTVNFLYFLFAKTFFEGLSPDYSRSVSQFLYSDYLAQNMFKSPNTFFFLTDLLFNKGKTKNKKRFGKTCKFSEFWCIYDTVNIYTAIWTLQSKNIKTSIFTTQGQYSCLAYMDR